MRTIPEDVKALKYEIYDKRRVALTFHSEVLWATFSHASDIYKFAPVGEYAVKTAVKELLQNGHSRLKATMYVFDGVHRTQSTPVFWIKGGYELFNSESQAEDFVVGLGCKRLTKVQMTEIANWTGVWHDSC